MTFPREKIKRLIYDLVIDGDDGIIAKAKKIHAQTIPSYLAAKSNKPEHGLAKPILASLLPYETLVGSSIERSLSTSMGWRLDTIFTEIARHNYSSAYGGKGEYVEISGKLPEEAVIAIDGIMSGLVNRSERVRPSQQEELKTLEKSITGPNVEYRSVRFDVFFLDNDSNREWCLESKTIKPNKGQLEAVKRDALTAQALKLTGQAIYKNSKGQTIPQNKHIQPILGTYYDAWGPLVDGNFPTINTFFELDTQFKSGRDTWNLVGKCNNTYDAFMNLLWEIHCERGEELRHAFRGQSIGQTDPPATTELDPTKPIGLVLKLPNDDTPIAELSVPTDGADLPADSPRLILTANREVWGEIECESDLKLAVQGEKIDISGYYPVLFTHQTKVVVRTLEGLMKWRSSTR